MPRVIEVIESQITRGAGLQTNETKYRGGLSEHVLLWDDQVRMVTQYHTLEGEFLAEVDPRHEDILKECLTKEEKNK